MAEMIENGMESRYLLESRHYHMHRARHGDCATIVMALHLIDSINTSVSANDVDDSMAWRSGGVRLLTWAR